MVYVEKIQKEHEWYRWAMLAMVGAIASGAAALGGTKELSKALLIAFCILTAFVIIYGKIYEVRSIHSKDYSTTRAQLILWIADFLFGLTCLLAIFLILSPFWHF